MRHIESFHEFRIQRSESLAQFINRLESYVNEWQQLSKIPDTVRAVLDLFIQEQLMKPMSPAVQTFVLERSPSSLDALTRLSKPVRKCLWVSF